MAFPKKLAERSGSRTHQRRPTPLDGFENRAPHRGAIPIRVLIVRHCIHMQFLLFGQVSDWGFPVTIQIGITLSPFCETNSGDKAWR